MYRIILSGEDMLNSTAEPRGRNRAHIKKSRNLRKDVKDDTHSVSHGAAYENRMAERQEISRFISEGNLDPMLREALPDLH